MPPRLFPESTTTGRCQSGPLSALRGRFSIQVFAGFVRRLIQLSLILPTLQLTGCDGLQKKHDNPVMVAAPRRVEPEEPTEVEQYAGKEAAPKFEKEIDYSNLPVVHKELEKQFTKNPWDGWKDDTTIFNSQVAATVNGVPILNGDILDRFAGFLIDVRTKMQDAAKDPTFKGQVPTPDDYEKFRYEIIKREIFVYIQRKLLVERLKSGMKAEQLKAMDAHIDEQFEKKVVELKQEMKVNNKTELEIALNKKGTTLKNIKDNFALERLAMEAIVIKSEKAKRIERTDLVAYYQSHPDEFKVTAKVRWEQIQISFGPSIDKSAAIKKLQQAVAEVKKGTSFETVAKKYSDGPTAKDGGVWDWMEEGNLADTKLEQMLFEMPTNVLSKIHEGPNSVSVVRVIERQEAGRKPFKEVQQEIYVLIENQQHKDRHNKVMKDIFSKAVIETPYDLPSFGPNE